MIWHPTRAAGLERLEAFVPHAGRAYAARRNIDLGPNDRSNVSALSPWIRRRMITEEEVIMAVRKAHSFAAAEKFIQEVVWRSYWKGWLEMRPSVLWQFDVERIALKKTLEADSALRRRFESAIEGRTGIDCFDAWAAELTELGWLHNHTRMWFASIWIFTLDLPWQLGADFFYKHLLDADPASNTLSWRWVAGLHTQGKHYLARADNIARNTEGRFNPTGQLNEKAEPLHEPLPPAATALPFPDMRQVGKAALLIHEEDLHPESLDLGGPASAIAILPSSSVATEASPADLFSKGALLDAANRAEQHFRMPVGQIEDEDLVDWGRQAGVQEIVTAYAPTGMVARRLGRLRTDLAEHGINLIQLRRDWDGKAWPNATAGFFKLKAKIPSLLSALI